MGSVCELSRGVCVSCGVCDGCVCNDGCVCDFPRLHSAPAGSCGDSWGPCCAHDKPCCVWCFCAVVCVSHCPHCVFGERGRPGPLCLGRHLFRPLPGLHGACHTFLSAVVDAHKTSVALVTKTSLRIKQVIALANFASLAGLGTRASMGWCKHANMIAVCEWAAVLLILAFNASFIHEFSGSYVAVIQDLPSVPDPASENDVPRSAYSRVSLIDVHHHDDA